MRHLGPDPLPYGLGVHPWFPRTPGTRLTAPVQGVWLCGDDPLPTAHTQRLSGGLEPERGHAGAGGR